MTEDRDPYATLAIASSATADEVAAAYRAQARRHHPDVSKDADAEQRMAEINAAWTLLRDPGRRAAWDRAHGIRPGGPRRAAGVPDRQGRPASRPEGTSTSPTWRRGPHGEGAAGPPPGNPRGSVLPFGRHIGWSLGEVARIDPGYLVWLQARREGLPYKAEIERLLEAIRPAPSEPEPAPRRRGRLFR